MFVLSFIDPQDSKPKILEWDLVKNKPAEGAVLRTPEEFEAYVKAERKDFIPFLPDAFANLQIRGTNHAITPSTQWLARSRYRVEGESPRPYTVADLSNLYGFQPETKKEETPEDESPEDETPEGETSTRGIPDAEDESPEAEEDAPDLEAADLEPAKKPKPKAKAKPKAKGKANGAK